MDYVIGIDVGTSGTKALAVDLKGRVLASAGAAYPLSAPEPGWAEQDPELWWKASLKAIPALLGSKALRGARPAALGLSGQMHSSVFLNAQGQVVRPALLWCDGRTSEECGFITKKIGEARLRRLVSNPALEGFTLPKLLWLKKHEPGAWKRVAKVVLPKDYIRYRLSGELASEYSDAAGTLMLDVAARRWSAELMKALSLPLSLLPELGESQEVLGRLSAQAARLTGLPQGLPLVGGGADNACGAVGVGAVSEGTAVASWGTSGTVLTPLSKPLVDPGLRAHTFCSAVPGQWMVMGVMLSAGGAFAWYRDELRSGADSLELNAEAAKSSPGARGLSFLPYLQGERTPHRDAAARGALVGMSLSHSKADASRAVLEGICFGLKDSLEIIRSLKGVKPLKDVLLTGGGAKSPMLRHLQADVFGLPVRTVDKEEGPAFGAALLAAVGAGAFKSLPQACAATLKRSAALRPGAESKQYAAPYARYRGLYGALKGYFHGSKGSHDS